MWVQLYREAANGPNLKDVKPSKSTVSPYGGSPLPVVGQVTLRVWRDSSHVYYIALLVDQKYICPILWRKAHIGMNIFQYTDKDAINIRE